MALRKRELLLVAAFIALIILGGIFPNIILDITRASSDLWISYLGH